MGINKSILLPLFLFVMFFACTGKKEEQQKTEDELYAEVMEIHDLIMPRMEDIYQYEKKCLAIQDSLTQADSIGNADEIAEIEALHEQLKSADEAMWTWMRAFKPQYKEQEWNYEERMKYLGEEKDKIIAVKDEMEAAIQEAEKKL